jgi:hypothetical protein
MNVQNNDMTQRPLSIVYDILSLTNSTLLTADVILLCTKDPVIHESHSALCRKLHMHMLVWCHLRPI